MISSLNNYFYSILLLFELLVLITGEWIVISLSVSNKQLKDCMYELQSITRVKEPTRISSDSNEGLHVSTGEHYKGNPDIIIISSNSSIEYSSNIPIVY